MNKIYSILPLFFFISGCGINSVLVPMVGIPTTNLLTREYYEDKYQKYDTSYRKINKFFEHRVPRGPYSLYAREFSRTSKLDKPVILLLHGFPDSLHIYDQVAPKLSRQYRVISFDFLGWGKSDKPDDHIYNSASLYHDLETIIAYFNFEKVSLVLHDASGPPGIDWAINNPNKMDMLVLLNTYYQPMEVLRTPEAIETFSTPSLKRSIIRTGAKISNYGWRTGFQNQLNKFFYSEEIKETMVPVLTHQAMNIRTSFFQLNNVLNQEAKIRLNKKQKLYKYFGYVKIIFGKDDPYLNSKVAEKLNEILPNSELNLVGNAAHFVQLDQPSKVANLILTEKISNKKLAERQK